MRFENWPQRLDAVVESARNRAYVLGEWDCLRFCCAAIAEMTGVDYWPRFAGYKTKRQALVTIARIAPSLRDAVTEVLGVSCSSPLMAMRGDVALYKDSHGEEHLGLCLGVNVAVLGLTGLAFIKITDSGLLASWRVN